MDVGDSGPFLHLVLKSGGDLTPPKLPFLFHVSPLALSTHTTRTTRKEFPKITKDSSLSSKR
jgi:hypothetical protein